MDVDKLTRLASMPCEFSLDEMEGMLDDMIQMLDEVVAKKGVIL